MRLGIMLHCCSSGLGQHCTESGKTVNFNLLPSSASEFANLNNHIGVTVHISEW